MEPSESLFVQPNKPIIDFNDKLHIPNHMYNLNLFSWSEILLISHQTPLRSSEYWDSFRHSDYSENSILNKQVIFYKYQSNINHFETGDNIRKDDYCSSVWTCWRPAVVVFAVLYEYSANKALPVLKEFRHHRSWKCPAIMHPASL